jgi:hypothetical protein
MRVHSGFLALWRSSSMAPAFLDAYARLAATPRPESGGGGVPTYVLGHSMGAALAHLCALDLTSRLGAPDVRVATFGSPRVGNAAFATFFRASVSQSWRFTHGRDIVPSVPLTLMGFRHVSREGGRAGGGRWGESSGSAPGRGRRPLGRVLPPAPHTHIPTPQHTHTHTHAHAHKTWPAPPSPPPRRPAVWLVDAAPPGGLAPPPRERMVVCDDSGEDPTCHASVCHLGLCTSVADHLTYLGAHFWAGQEC